MDESEFVEKIGLEDYEDKIAFVDNVGSVEDCAGQLFQRVEDDDDGDSALEA